MQVKWLAVTSSLVLLVACGGGSSSTEDSATLPTPVADQQQNFSVSLQYPPTAKAGETIEIVLVPSSGNDIQNSSIEHTSEVVEGIMSVDATRYTVTVPVLLENQTFHFTATAVNEANEQITASGEIDMLFNIPPRRLQADSVGALVEDAQQYNAEFELSADDEDGIASFAIIPLYEGVEVTQRASDIFTVSVAKPLDNWIVDGDPEIVVPAAKAIVTDNLSQSSTFRFPFRVARPAGGDIQGQTHVLIDSVERYSVRLINQAADIAIDRVEWRQRSGSPLEFNVDEFHSMTITFGATPMTEAAVFEATVTLSDGNALTATKTVTQISNRPFTAIPMDNATASEQIARHDVLFRDNPLIDVNKDGLADEVRIVDGIVQLFLSQTDGSTVAIENAGQISLHQFTRMGFDLDLPSFREEIEAWPLGLEDVDNDGFDDLLIRVNMQLTNRVFYFWLKATDASSTFFSHDYSFGVNGLLPWRDNLIDLNDDGIKDLIGVDTITNYQGPYASCTAPDTTLDANPFCATPFDGLQALGDHVFLRDIDGNGEEELVSFLTDGIVGDGQLRKSWIRVQAFDATSNRFEPGYAVYFADEQVERLMVYDANEDGVDDIVVALNNFATYAIIDIASETGR